MRESVMIRALLIGPVVFVLIGAGTGVSLAMLYRQDPRERAHVGIEDSLPLAISGAAAGGFLGGGVMGVYRLWRRLRPLVELLALTLLGSAAAAPIGWVIGDSKLERMPQEGMARGAMLGAMIGFLLGIVQIVFDYCIAWHRKPNTVNEHSS